MPADQNQTGNTFINGKAQIIEMLSIMDPAHRNKLLNDITVRDPIMGAELRERSISVNILDRLEDKELKTLIAHTPAQVWGLAIRDRGEEFQKRSLRLADRTFAQEAYSVMKMGNIGPDKVKSAHRKIVTILISLTQRNIINLG